jgi:hypothetical protein
VQFNRYALQEGTTSFLKSSGVDVDSIAREATVATKTVTDVSNKATPFLTKAYNFLSSSSPETLGKIAIVLVAAYYLTPFALKTAVASLRGYAGMRTHLHPNICMLSFHPLLTSLLFF